MASKTKKEAVPTSTSSTRKRPLAAAQNNSIEADIEQLKSKWRTVQSQSKAKSAKHSVQMLISSNEKAHNKDLERYLGGIAEFTGLKAGDVWILIDGRLLLLFERKTLQNLSASIGNDADQQKFKLSGMPIDTWRILYLIEWNNAKWTPYMKGRTYLVGAQANILLRDRMALLHTQNLQETVYFLLKLLIKAHEHADLWTDTLRRFPVVTAAFDPIKQHHQSATVSRSLAAPPSYADTTGQPPVERKPPPPYASHSGTVASSPTRVAGETQTHTYTHTSQTNSTAVMTSGVSVSDHKAEPQPQRGQEHDKHNSDSEDSEASSGCEAAGSIQSNVLLSEVEKAYVEAFAIKKKQSVDNQRTCYLQQLQCVRGLSLKRALTIAEAFPTMVHLAAFLSNPLIRQDQRLGFIAKLTYESERSTQKTDADSSRKKPKRTKKDEDAGPGRRRIGPALAKRLWAFIVGG